MDSTFVGRHLGDLTILFTSLFVMVLVLISVCISQINQWKERRENERRSREYFKGM